MINSIINALNLKDEDVDSIASISSFQNEDFLITLKLKDHICPSCGSLTHSIKDYKIRTIHQKVFLQFNSVIYYKVRRYICNSCGKSFIEKNPFGCGNKRIPPAMIIQVLDALKPFNSTFSSVARNFDVSVSSVIDIFDKHVQMRRKPLSSILCWDEFYFNRHSKYKYAFMIMDFEKKVILDIIESRHMNILSSYFYTIPVQERSHVRYIIIDMYKNYRDLAKIYFPKAVICVDPFHAMKRINDALNSIRKRILRKYNDDKDSESYKLLKYRYRLILKNRCDLEIEKRRYDKIVNYSITERDMLDKILSIDKHLKNAYYIKEKYVSFNCSKKEYFKGRKEKEEELDDIMRAMAESKIHEFIDCIKTLNTWRDEILNSFSWINDKRVSNGPIEGKNTYIKKIISNANGYSNFERARNKFMYSQNLYDTYSLVEHKHTVKRKFMSRGPYKKEKKTNSFSQ